MEFSNLGSSELKVSRVGFGCWAIGGHGYGPVDDRESMAAVRKALDLGINLFDTADVYGFGHSEEVLAAALGTRRKDVVVATKFGVKWDVQGKITYDVSPARVLEAVEDSLRRLRLECIPLYQIHWPDGKTPISATLEALMRCRDAGKIRYIGCSNFPPGLIREAHAIHPMASVQAPYNILDHSIEPGILPTCQELGLSLLAHSPLAQGLLTGKFGTGARFHSDDIRSTSIYFQEDQYETNLKMASRVKDLAVRYGKTEAQVAIRWILDSCEIACAIPGAKSLEQIENNAGAMDWKLSPDDLRYLFSEVQVHEGVANRWAAR